MKYEINTEEIQQAAMLHDYGKVLIPKEILYKEGKLTLKERKIMDLHSEFGYQILKEKGISERVLNLIKQHHKKNTTNDNKKLDIEVQILEVADMYSALTEDRAYHKAYSKEEALNIIYKEVEAGIISKKVYDALKKSGYN